ncbi:MAG: phosphoribosylanthranilate isomerase [candidate division WOR-3 bacterium]
MDTKIKICGITSLKDALIAVECGADAIGFVFANSPRRVEPFVVREIIDRLPPFITTVGVFKDDLPEDINRIVELTGIKVVQLHGSETPEYCRSIRNAKLIKTIKIDNKTTYAKIVAQMDRYNVSAFLFDPGEGSGRIFNWKLLEGIKGMIIVAGGLNERNVRALIKLLNPYGVDVCTGVEARVGEKDPLKIKRFVQEVRKCSLPA